MFNEYLHLIKLTFNCNNYHLNKCQKQKIGDIIKKHLIIILLLAGLLFVNCAFASDSTKDIASDNIEKDNSHLSINDINLVQNTSNSNDLKKSDRTDKIGKENTNTLTSDNKNTSFKNLNDIISNSNSSVELNKDFTFNNTTDQIYINGVQISKDNFVINGNNHIIDGQNQARILNITGNNITLKNIIFKNGASDNKAGAVYITGLNIKINNCTFINNTAHDGGAIASYGANTTVTNSEFYNNSAKYNGAIYINSENGKITNSNFENNYANVSAGAIGWAYQSYGLIENCTFTNNQAPEQNAEKGGGGAIFWNEGQNAIIRNSKFTNNKAYMGGAIYLNAPINEIIYNCTFENNSATSGGAVYTDSLNKTAQDSAVIENSLFKNNTATIGGAIYLKNIGTIIASNFTGNTADNGGAIYTNNILSITSASLTNNRATNGTHYIALGSEGKVSLNNNKDAIVTNNIYGETVKITVDLSMPHFQTIFTEGNLTISLNGNNYNATIINGVGIFEIPRLTASSYSCDINYTGNNFTASLNPITFTVLKQNAVITAKDATYVINYGGKYSITVKDAKGNALANQAVVFSLNGKTVGSVNTDKNGIATITLTAKQLKTAGIGSKKLAVTLSSSNYIASKTVNIKINKEKTKITAKAKKFKRVSKTKKYTVKLKNSKGKAVKKAKVTLKIKGKTYKATTTTKGKATFKITKLTKKGKYTAKISYSGNKLYQAVKKSAKITIK